MFLPQWYKDEINYKLQLLYNVALFKQVEKKPCKRKLLENDTNEKCIKKPCLDNGAECEETNKPFAFGHDKHVANN
jgi:hypothetical protein